MSSFHFDMEAVALVHDPCRIIRRGVAGSSSKAILCCIALQHVDKHVDKNQRNQVKQEEKGQFLKDVFVNFHTDGYIIKIAHKAHYHNALLKVYIPISMINGQYA